MAEGKLLVKDHTYFIPNTATINKASLENSSYHLEAENLTLVLRNGNDYEYYIKCRDFFGNEPNPDECSLIASASNIV